ncbi:major capsid protein [Glutamicibacter sp. AOP3-A1-12]|uniref:major capsid protein n=1 Tax=Glutamicibacter sp. AOP3-A1-12 TaxID=3457701 RepID=UPI0040333820
MIVFDAPVGPDAATEFSRAVPENQENSLLSEAPSRTIAGNSINFAELVRRNRTARYRSFDGRVHVSERDSANGGSVGMIPLSTSSNMGEYERLQLEFARTEGTNKAALVDAIYDDVEQLTLEVQARLEQAWGDALTDGVLTINENGLVGFEADFGVPDEHKVTAGVPWAGASTSKPLTDLTLWNDQYRLTNGIGAAAVRTSQTQIRNVLRSQEVIDALYGSAAGRTVARLVDLNDYLSGEGLPVFIAPYDTTVDVDGVLTRTIPEDRVLLTPASIGDLGYTAWGVTVTALELVNSKKVEMSFQEAPGLVGVVVKNDGVPFRQFTYVDAVAMPVLNAPKRLLTAQV